jgi:hypothetical protein
MTAKALAKVRAIIGALDATSEKLSHGSPAWFTCGKQFAAFADHHHNDGRLALWLIAPPGAQAMLIDADPKHYFAPPYVGPSGWIGVRLDGKLAWDEIAEVVRTAWAVRYKLPRKSTPLQRVRMACMTLAGVTERASHGSPSWLVGGKQFACYDDGHHGDGLALHCAAPAGAQAALVDADPAHYFLPPYTARHGWIGVRLDGKLAWDEIAAVIDAAYREKAARKKAHTSARAAKA